MTTKAKIKKEIERMPDKLLEKVYRYINNLKTNPDTPKPISTFKLKGKFDKVNVREKAYE